MKQYDVIIIGAGTAGLSARREVAKLTQNYLVIDDGPLGTTCARVGCMPSKVLIQVANDFHRRLSLDKQGIRGGQDLRVDSRAVMNHVRALRDRFVRGVVNDMDEWQSTHLLRARARILDPYTVEAGGERLKTNRLIVATGSSPIRPRAWDELRDRLIDTDAIFELEELPRRVAVVGLGVIGLEIGQALHRLGVDVVGIGQGKAIGGLTDPEVADYTRRALSREMKLSFEGVDRLERLDSGVRVHSKSQSWDIEHVILAMGRKPNVSGLGLENLGVPINSNGLPAFDPQTGRIGDTSVFIAGDVNGERPILHEAADEGRIVGYNAVHNPVECFKRRTFLAITFSDPNIAVIGESHDQLVQRGARFAVGSVSFEGQGRSIVKLKEQGLLHVFGDLDTGRILGAELFAPDGEHLAHLLAWMIALDQHVDHVLSLPFYHPVVEEGLRTGLRDLSNKVNLKISPLEVLRCQDPPTEHPLTSPAL